MREGIIAALFGLLCLAAIWVVYGVEGLPEVERIGALGSVAQAIFGAITAYFAFVGLSLWRHQLSYQRQAKVAVALLDQVFVCGHAIERIRAPALHLTSNAEHSYKTALAMAEDVAPEFAKLRTCSISFRAITGNDHTTGDVQILITLFDNLRGALTTLHKACETGSDDPDYEKNREIAVAIRHDRHSSRVQTTMERIRETVQPFL